MRNLALTCAALAIVAGIVSLNLWRDLRAERLTTTQLRAQLREAAAASAPFLPPQPARPEPVVGGSQTAAAAAAAPQPATPSAAADAASRNLAVNLRIDQRELLKDPEYRKAALAQARMNVPRSYPDLFEVLGLGPEMSGRLADLLAEQQLEQNSMISPIGADGQIDRAAMEEMSRRAEELQRRRDEQIAALIGPAGMEEFKAYEQTRSARMQAQSVRQTLESAGLPLTPAQMRPVTDAYIAAQREQLNPASQIFQMAQQSGGAGPDQAARLREAMMDMQAERNRRLIEAVRPHLSAQQVERLQQNFEQQQVMSRAQTRILSERMEQQGGAQSQVGVITFSSGVAPPPQP